jgi:hypothetical protein
LRDLLLSEDLLFGGEEAGRLANPKATAMRLGHDSLDRSRNLTFEALLMRWAA